MTGRGEVVVSPVMLSLWGDAVTSACRLPSPSLTAAPGSRSTTSATTAVRRSTPARLPFTETWCRAGPAPGDQAGLLAASADPATVGSAEHVIVVITGPADQAGGPAAELDSDSTAAALAGCGHFRDGQILILRSTVTPGTTAIVEKLLARLGIDMDVAFCPERIAEGHAMTELYDAAADRRQPLGQRSGAGQRAVLDADPRTCRDDGRRSRAGQAVHQRLAVPQVRRGQPVLHDRQRPRPRLRTDQAGCWCGITREPRTSPPAGFAAGPCLLKDTAGLARATSASLWAGRRSPSTRACPATWSAVSSGASICLDDRRDARDGVQRRLRRHRFSLAYLLADLLASQARRVLCTDPLVTSDPDLLPLDVVLGRADLLVIGRRIRTTATSRPTKPVVDIWNLLGRGVLA